MRISVPISGFSRGVRRGAQVGGRRGGDHAGFGGVVVVVEDVAELVHEPGDDVGAHPGSRCGGEPQRTTAVAAAHLVGQIHDPVEHHRHHAQAGGLVAVDEIEGRFRVELAPGRHRAAQRRGEDQLGKAPGVKHRRHDHRRLFGVPRHAVEDRLEFGRATTGMLGALGVTGSSRRQQDQFAFTVRLGGPLAGVAAISFSTVVSCGSGWSVHATTRVVSGLSASARSTDSVNSSS